MSEKFSKTGRLFALTGRREEIIKMERSSRRMERDAGSVEYFDAMVSASAKIYVLLSKKRVSFFSVV